MIPVTITIEKDGGNLTFLPGDISSVDYVSSVSLDGDEMSVDEITVTVRQDNPDWLAQWTGVSRAAPVWLTLAGSAPRTEKYYYKSVQRVAKRDFQITAQSPLGRLAADFPGAVYNAKPLPDVIADVIGGVIPYSCNSLLGTVRVYGWAPYQSRRESLHALAFAYGFLVRRNANQDLYFTVPDTVPYPIPENNVFTGGSVSYSFGNAYARAEITAADWRADPSAAEQTLFDNSGGVAANHNLVKFDAPMFDLKTSDYLSIDDSGAACGVNFAYVSGTGTLTGKPYSKYISVVSVDGDPGADPLQVLSVTDAPLITSLNAASVGQRLLDCRNAPATVNADIIRTIQRPGDCVSFVDPFGDERTGHIAALSGSITSFDRASATIVCGYSPSWGAAYDAVFVLTDTDAAEWAVPDFLDGKKVRVVLIGGGQGGASGQHGTDDSAVGSGRGLPGGGGKILDFTIAVNVGETYPYQCGVGGAAGTASDDTTADRPDNMTVYATRTGDRWHLNPHCNGGAYSPTTLKKAIERHLTPCENCVKDSAAYYISNPGAPGGDTSFGDFSTADEKAAPAPAGFFDIVDGVQYATPGPDNGADGGQATAGRENGQKDNPAWEDVQTFAVALQWDTSQSWTSGGVGESYIHREAGAVDEWAYGGLGGGGAVGNNGGDGGNGRFTTQVTGGDGGNGANATAVFPAETLPYGSGGSGGHGGGEGGKGGSGHSDEWSDPHPGRQGSGGSGSDGQPGADGCILIYYKKPDDKQFSFSVKDGHLILTYYTPEPPPFYLDESKHLRYRLAEGETPPNYVIRNGHLYLSK